MKVSVKMKKTVKYYLADQEVGSICFETHEEDLHRKYGWPPVERIDCVSILDLISKLIERMQNMQYQIEANNEEIQDLYRSINND